MSKKQQEQPVTESKPESKPSESQPQTAQQPQSVPAPTPPVPQPKPTPESALKLAQTFLAFLLAQNLLADKSTRQAARKVLEEVKSVQPPAKE
jgi:hypothetical protein